MSNVDTAGYVEDQLLTNATERDQGALYSQRVTGVSDDTVTCSSASPDKHHLMLALVRGPFQTSPKDLSDESGRAATSPVETGASSSSTYQIDEVMIGITCARSSQDQISAWVRQGTALPISDMTIHSGDGISSADKRIEGANQVLTEIGTVGVSRTFTVGSPLMIGYATYKKSAQAYSAQLDGATITLTQDVFASLKKLEKGKDI